MGKFPETCNLLKTNDEEIKKSAQTVMRKEIKLAVKDLSTKISP